MLNLVADGVAHKVTFLYTLSQSKELKSNAMTIPFLSVIEVPYYSYVVYQTLSIGFRLYADSEDSF